MKAAGKPYRTGRGNEEYEKGYEGGGEGVIIGTGNEGGGGGGVTQRFSCQQHYGPSTRSGTEKGCSHKLKSGHPAWWSAKNCLIFPTVKIS